jgi:hypothetical protein
MWLMKHEGQQMARIKIDAGFDCAYCGLAVVALVTLLTPPQPCRDQDCAADFAREA